MPRPRRRNERARWLAVAGARPNFVKLAPLVRAAKALRRALPWVHTGQHWDRELSREMVDDLGLPRPIRHLAVGAGTASEQTARILERLPRVLEGFQPDLVVVVGDVTSTLAAALAAAQAGVPVAHVEAGLRSFDESMPEERNRVLVDRLAARLYVTEPAGVKNLADEGVASARVRIVGNPMIDALRHAAVDIALRAPKERGFALVTLHRPSNVDDGARLSGWAHALEEAAASIPVRFPVHPRTALRLRRRGLDRRLARAGVVLMRPLRYLDFAAHLSAARVVLTDSGGIQEEAAYLGVPCLTLRTTTEHPMTITMGLNRLVGDDPAALRPALARVLRAPPPRRKTHRLWDGRAAERIVADLDSITS